MYTLKEINKTIKAYEKLIQLELKHSNTPDIYTVIRLNQLHKMKEELLK